jgi:hypothetical protein
MLRRAKNAVAGKGGQRIAKLCSVLCGGEGAAAFNKSEFGLWQIPIAWALQLPEACRGGQADRRSFRQTTLQRYVMKDIAHSPPSAASGPDKAYQEKLKEGRFEIQRCEACLRHVFYPRVVCSHCGSASLQWIVASGRGAVYATTTAHYGDDPAQDVNIALIDLEEGVRMMSRVEGMSSREVRIGMAVQASIIEEDGQALLVFRAAGAER